MDISKFFQQSAGKWFSHRTNHYLDSKQSQSGRSNLTVEVLEPDHATVAGICQRYGAALDQVLCGLQITWDGTLDKEPRKQVGSMVLVIIPDAQQPNTGILLRQIASSQTPPVPTQFILGEDQVLTLTDQQDGVHSEERLWFASPNLRMRTQLAQYPDGRTLAAFTTEIRMGGAPVPASSAGTTAQAG
jgi:hypothetical protein